MREILERRRVTRSFSGRAVDEAWLDERCAEALWAPTAGHSCGVRLYTLGASFVEQYLRAATDPEWRTASARVAGLRRAGALVLVTARVSDYTERYGEADKAPNDLADAERWTVPYWHGDAAMATMALMLLLEEGDLGCAIWGNFGRGEAVLDWAGIEHDGEELFATLFVGHSDGQDRRSASLARAVPSRSDRVRRLRPA